MTTSSGGDDVKVNDSAAHAPEEVQKWAKKFVDRHGCPGVLSREVNGYHLYIPCPYCLETHGRRELDDPKYSINLSMLAGLGEFRDTREGKAWAPGQFEASDNLEKRREYGSGVCMRTRSSRSPHRIPIESLLNMATVTERHPDIHTSSAIHGGTGSAEREEMWEEDPVSGGMCPPPAGECVSLHSLPGTHPAVAYLTGRGYDVSSIEPQFRLGFCVEEYPYGEKGIYYRKMPGGWKDTPRHRLVFHSLVGGVPLTWQARVIERISDDELDRYMLHPYAGGFFPSSDLGEVTRQFKEEGWSGEPQMTWDEERRGYWMFMWSHTHTRPNPATKWIPVAPFDEMRDGVLKFQPSKYRTAKYSSRQIMGWDAALQRAREDTDDIKWCVLCEGPLDAARVGPGGIALIGSSISEDNAAKVASNFHVAFTAFDADKAGREATEKVTSILHGVKCRAPILNFAMPLPIPSGKDLGDLTAEEYQKIFKRALKRSKR